MMKITGMVKHLIIINVIMFVVFHIMFPQWRDTMGLFYPLSGEFRPYQLVTHMFMHGDFTHLLFNLFALYMFGSVLENRWGPKRFLIFYFLCGFGALGLHLLVKYIQLDPLLDQIAPENLKRIAEQGRSILLSGQNFTDPILAQANQIINISTVGASGAIYGLLIAFGMMYPREKLYLIFFPVGIEARFFIPLMIAGELYLGLNRYSWDNMAHFAHLGGALIGFLLILYWRKYPPNY